MKAYYEATEEPESEVPATSTAVSNQSPEREMLILSSANSASSCIGEPVVSTGTGFTGGLADRNRLQPAFNMLKLLVGFAAGFYCGAYFQDKYKISPVSEPRQFLEKSVKMLQDLLDDKKK
ncbi:hypothetical protein SprV_0802601900 [Sparganum proliferum]